MKLLYWNKWSCTFDNELLFQNTINSDALGHAYIAMQHCVIKVYYSVLLKSLQRLKSENVHTKIYYLMP